MKRSLYLCVLFLVGWVLQARSQTGFKDDFNAGRHAGWYGSSKYTLVDQNGALLVKVRKDQTWQSFGINLPSSINVSAAPYVNLKVKPTTKPFVLSIYLVDEANKNKNIERRILPSEDFVNVCWDFSPYAANVDLTKIKALYVAVNGQALSFEGDLLIDDLKVGSEATALANIGGVDRRVYYANSGSKTIKLTDILNASAIEVKSEGKVIENVAVSSIATGSANLTFDVKDNIAGSETITLTAKGTGSFADNSCSFIVEVENNNAPTLSPVEDATGETGKWLTIPLTGISDGNAAINQEITINLKSSASGVIPAGNMQVEYDGWGTEANLLLKPTSDGESDVYIFMRDEGGMLFTDTFGLTVYDDFNSAPTVDPIPNADVLADAGASIIPLTGISDGDVGSQTLSFEITSSDPTVVANESLSVTYTPGNSTASLNYTPLKAGETTLTLTITDNGGNAGNNGNASTTITIRLEVLGVPMFGYEIPVVIADYQSDRNRNLWNVEGEGAAQNISYVNFGGFDCIKIDCIKKSTWTGLWYRIPELNLADNPYISYDIYSVTSNLQTHCYLYDNAGSRNGPGAHGERKDIAANQWVSVTMDYSDPAYQKDDAGNPINMQRIDTMLLNYHPSFGWPFTDYAGTVYIKNIKLGTEAENIPVKTPKCTVKRMPDLSVFENPGQFSLQISGLSNGAGDQDNVTVLATSDNTSFIPNPTVGAVSGGTVDINFNPSSGVNSANIQVVVSATGSTDSTITFKINTLSSDPANAGTLSIDKATTYQTIDAFGTSLTSSYLLDDMINDVGISIFRIFPNGDGLEPVNDNDDPMVLNLAGFKPGVDMDAIRTARDLGCTRFFLTLLSPPGWMKQNLSSVYGFPAAPDWESTDNKVQEYDYQEYAEHIIGIIKMIKNETGVELTAICPQNEPAFCEPYGSGILSPVQAAKLNAILGPRLVAEGLSTQIIVSEQVFDQGHYSVNEYIDQVQANSAANQYTPIVGVHYPDDNSGQWSSVSANAAAGTYPKKLWATESQCAGDYWDGVIDVMSAITTGLKYGMNMWNNFETKGPASFADNDVNPVGGSGGPLIAGTEKTRSYYAYKHFARFVRPGAVRIKVTSPNSNLLATAYLNSEAEGGNMAIVLINKATTPMTILLDGSDLPNQFQFFQTTRYEKCEAFAWYGVTEKLIIPARGIVTLCSQANNQPTIDQVANRYYAINSTAETITLAGITDGDEGFQNLTVEAESSLPSLVTTSLTYTSGNTGSLTLTPLAAQKGVANITVTVTDDGTPASQACEMSFTVAVSGNNNAPSLSPVSKVTILEDAGLQQVNLSGITDNDGGSQPIAVSVYGYDLSLITAPVVSYTSGASGTFSFTPQHNANGSSVMQVGVDDGGDVNPFASVPFELEITPVNDAPEADFDAENDTILMNAGAHTFYLTNVHDGDEGLQTLSVSVTSDNAALTANKAATLTGDQIEVSFTPATGQTGIANLSIRLEDNGGTANQGVDAAVFVKKIVVEEPDDNAVPLREVSFGLYPNPANDYITVKCNNSLINRIEILTLTGQTLLSQTLRNPSETVALPVSGLKPGMYFVRLSGQNVVGCQRFVKD